MDELACVVHVHSRFSDGTATVPEIVEACRASGGDAVLLTDHDTLEARRRGFEGWHDDVLVVVGHEVSSTPGHLLVFGVESEIGHEGVGEADILRRVSEAGGVGFAAHPFSTGSRMSRRIGRPHPWSELRSDDLTGIELWSVLTEAAEGWRSPLEAARFMRAPASALEGPPASNLEAWDRLCAERRVVAIGGLDAHQSGVRLPGGRVFSPLRHELFFGWLRTHVVAPVEPGGDSPRDVAAVLDALRAGRCFLGVDGLAPTAGFRVWAERDGERVEMGGQAEPGPWTLQVRLPEGGEISVLRDGAEIARATGTEATCDAGRPGAYRVEVRRPDQRGLWIVSNPVYLRM